MIDALVRPTGPYRLHLMTYGKALFSTPLPDGGTASAWQGNDGLLRLRAPDEAGLELLRFVLAVDDDTSEFTARFRHDPLLGPSIRGLHGLRPLRRSTVAHAVLRAICGQLIESRRARALERAILRACGEPAPRREAIGALSPAQLRRLGLATPRGSTLVRLCRTIDLEGLRDQPLAGGRGQAPPRAWLRAVVARSRRARGARQLPLRPRRRPRADQALLRAARSLGRGVGDGRAARAVRRVGGSGGRLPDDGVGPRPRPGSRATNRLGSCARARRDAVLELPR